MSAPDPLSKIRCNKHFGFRKALSMSGVRIDELITVKRHGNIVLKKAKDKNFWVVFGEHNRAHIYCDKFSQLYAERMFDQLTSRTRFAL